MKKLIFCILISSSFIAVAEENKYLQCMRDLCGPEQNYAVIAAEGPFGEIVPLEVKSFIKEKAGPRLNQIIQLSQKNAAVQTKAIKNLIEHLAKKPFSDEHLFMTLVMAGTSPRLLPLIEESLEPSDNGIKYKINIEKALSKIPEQDQEISSQALKAVNALLANKKYATSQEMMAKTETDFDVISKVLSFTSTWEGSVSNLENSVANFEKKLGPFAFMNENKSVLKKARKPESLSRSEKRDFMKLNARVALYESLPESLSSLDFSLRKVNIKKLLNFMEILPHADKVTKLLASQDEISRQTKDLLQICHKNINQAFAASPSQLKIQKAKELMTNVKQAAKVAAASYFKGETLEKARASIENVRFMNPPSMNEIEERLLYSLDSEIEKGKNFLLKTAEASSPKSNNWRALLAFTLGPIAQPTETFLWGSISNFCDSLRPPPLTDSAYWTQDIRVSWQTATFTEWGAGILAHEIGHVVSQTMEHQTVFNESKNGYDQVGSCSIETHKALHAGEIFTGSPDQYKEEDWADAFAITTIKELKKTWPYSKNFACTLVKKDQANNYTNLSFLNLNTDDTHSAAFYRVIQVHMALEQKLPMSCEKVLEPHQKEALASSCAK